MGRVTAADRAALTRSYYDELGAAERHRLTKDLPGRVSFEVHCRFLASRVAHGFRVLEVGAGPGRFTEVLAGLGASVVVTDISPVQLDLNRQYLNGTPAEAAVERRELLDVCDTARYADGEFDAVVAYGGPLSYAFEEEEAALAGLLRITRPGGAVVASVMSMLGSWRHRFAGVAAVAQPAGEDANDRVLATGDLRHMGAAHACRMFRASEVEALAQRAGGRLTASSASNWASLSDPATLAAIEADPDRWSRFLEHEVRACAEPGAVDGGTHILFALAHAS
jgi:SAM-dependent methyltransferase